MSGLAGYYDNNFPAQQAVNSYSNNLYHGSSGAYGTDQTSASESAVSQHFGIDTKETAGATNYSTSGSSQVPNVYNSFAPPQASYQNQYSPQLHQQQSLTSDVESFQSGYQNEQNSSSLSPSSQAYLNNYSQQPQQWQSVNEQQQPPQAYPAPQNQVASPPPISNYFSQSHQQFSENHVLESTNTQQQQQSYSQGVPSSYLSQAASNYSSQPPPTFQHQRNQSQYYATQGDKAAAMPQLYPPPPPNQPTYSPQQPSYQQNSYPAQSPSLVRHHQMTQRIRSPNVSSSIQDQCQQRYAGNSNRQNSLERVPGASISSEEWNLIKGPISLVNDSNFLPNDGPEKPPKPILTIQVNCHPDYLRSTLTAVPINSKLQSKCRLPFGLLAHPFRDVNDLPVIQTTTIVRCRSCRLYINPFVKFIDNGRRWRCPVCLLSNTVPDDFFYDPTTKTYGDPARRPEIKNATVEFIAPSDYMIRPPQAATYLFCLEVSRSAVTTGYLDLVCTMIADYLEKMPGDSRRQIGILTYDSGVQFYVFKGKKMKMVICQDLSEVFLPDLNGMVNRISDCAEPIIELLRQIPKEFANTQDTSNCLGFALQTALKLIGNTGGRLSVFNTSIPNVGPGKLENRETHDDLTKPNPDHLRPSSDFYRTIALEFSQAYISVDMFMLNSNYCDIATISGVSRYSGGSLYHYPNFHYDPEVHGPPSVSSESGDAGNVQPDCKHQQKKVAPHELCDYVEVESLRKDFQRYLTRKIGFEAVLRVRCSRGVNVQNFYGNFFMRSVDLLNLPVVNPDAGYALQLEVNERLDSFPQVVLQSALLYTSAYGDRRIRVHTLCLPVTDSPEAVFNYADEGAIACLVTKMAVERTISAGLSNAREALTTVMNDILTAYENERNSGSSRSSTLSGICPASLRLFPAYLCGVLRFPAFRNHLPTSLDVRSGALELIIGASASQTLALLYPRLYTVNSFISEPICGKGATLSQKAAALSLNDSSPLATAPPLPCLPLTGKSITRDGVYLLDTGNLVLLLVGYGIPAADLKSLIGYSSTDELTVDKAVTKLGDLLEGEKAPPPRRRLQTLIKSIQRERSLGTALVLIRHDVPEPLKGRFINALIEDRSPSCPSYSEYVQMILNGQA
ncbi:unnamed protein product [Hymenolepis diminuta]|uniref:Protein transport protein Sec24A n=1 Tax=Hymenolepis diminuta TaxID=6216 RepID=A0A158QBT7_HYMDI|nr:unnamed protein product [Hymenolepis diminuta]VUZ46077.1 unnamed protein product [Hymenolepis diminuta]